MDRANLERGVSVGLGRSERRCQRCGEIWDEFSILYDLFCSEAARVGYRRIWVQATSFGPCDRADTAHL